MRSLSDTIERLARLRQMTGGATSDTTLQELQGFGSNPGGLKARYHIPDHVDKSSALVVALHGCTQTASDYDAGSGWTALAEDYGFVVLLPEQTRQNNANLCFNWFNPQDTGRDEGEAMSIRQMITTLVNAHHLDERRIFITGLSAGAIMANAMLACYPDLFAGGALIAGLPFSVATSIPEAFDRMRGHGLPATDVLQARLRAASHHDGAWPTLSVWHGERDNTVVTGNALATVAQWRGVHGVEDQPTLSERFGTHSRSVWRDASGADAIELYSIPQMGHGVPIDPACGYGRTMPFMLDVGLSSTVQIARSWGLAASFERREGVSHGTTSLQPSLGQHPTAAGVTNDIQSTIERALRAAGLMN